ncbi:MAG: hypothetical protein EPO01_20325 [Aquabacterium sp.]|nr:MAG: hypothetical protein EPO01_20325 [Aquabacterium sp.]
MSGAGQPPSQPGAGWGGPTQLATQIHGADQEEEQSDRDIGKNVGNQTRELFVVCEPAEALRQQFERHRQPYIVLHGVGTLGSRKLLASIAQAAGWPQRRLVIRRQGFGNTLAELFYVDCPAHDGKLLRLYATEVEAEPMARSSVSRLLLRGASMAGLLLDNLPEGTLASTLRGLHEDLLAAGTCRHLVFLPQARSDHLIAQVEELKRRGLTQSEVAPATTQPAALWALVATAWNRVHQPRAAQGSPVLRQIAIGARAPASRPAAPVRPAAEAAPVAHAPAIDTPARSTTAVPAAGAAPAQAAGVSATDDTLRRYVEQLKPLAGVRGGCVFELHSLKVLATLDGAALPDKLAQQGRQLIMAAAQAGPVLGLGAAIGELLLSLGSAQLLLRPVPRRAGVLLHLVIERGTDLEALRVGLKRADLELAG